MKVSIKILLATLTLAFSTGAMAESAKDAIKAAKAAQKEASSLGFEWRDMGRTIKKAEAARSNLEVPKTKNAPPSSHPAPPVIISEKATKLGLFSASNVRRIPMSPSWRMTVAIVSEWYVSYPRAQRSDSICSADPPENRKENWAMG